jgi:hypothetical protein
MYGPGLPAEEQALLRDLLSAAEKMVYRDLPAGGERPRH